MKVAESANYQKLVIAGEWDNVLSPKVTPESRLKFLNDLMRLKAQGKEIYIIRNPPVHIGFNPIYLGKFLRNRLPWSKRQSKSPSHLSRYELESMHKQTNLQLDEFFSDLGVVYINPFDYFCPDGKCPLFQDDGIHPTHIDEWHTTASEVKKRATFIDEIVQ